MYWRGHEDATGRLVTAVCTYTLLARGNRGRKKKEKDVVCV
jgi:hypothetical protein